MRRKINEKENYVKRAFSQHNGCLFNSATTAFDLPPVFRSVRASWNAFVSLSVCPPARKIQLNNKGVGDRDAAAFKNKYGRNSKARELESDGRTWLEDC